MAWRFLEAEVLVHKYTAVYNRNQVLENQVLEVEILHIVRENFSFEILIKLQGARFKVNVGNTSVLCAGDVFYLRFKILPDSLSHSSVLGLLFPFEWVPEIQVEEVEKADWLHTLDCVIQESMEIDNLDRVRKLHYGLFKY